MSFGRARFITGFLFAPILLYAVYVLYPYAQTAYYSVTDFSGFSPDFAYVGFGNYVELFEDEVFLKALGHNVVVLTVFPVVTILLALFFAFMLNVGGRGDKAGVRGVRGSSVYKFIFFFPQVLSIAIVAVIWRRVFQSNDGGLINSLLMAMGLVEKDKPLMFLAEGESVFPPITIGNFTFEAPVVLVCLILIAIWGGVGFYLVLFSAAMQSIPKDIFEAATLDGATRVQTFFRVTLPLLREHVSVAWVYLGIAALDFYALVVGMTPGPGGGGPNDASQVMSSYMMSNAFRPSRFDSFAFACAMGVSIAILTLLLAAVQLRVTRSRDKLEF
ncbi:carbohydrate ABC transporter permease [Catellatospora bangladeshensis]|uniref:Sugar ABC transporter permease n=1 Tax=Catellatospora bangladeshensis TaxID=310355 RepID=A0A8J3JJ43_9ACTN|nr:sugar ABC transporter permease [Catellatospora bangladeshensis]GIF79503.1 sugar ABC transporter permease [Catellatospora bangladeshensis]